MLTVVIILGLILIAGGAAFVIVRRQQSQDGNELPPPEIGELVDYTAEPELEEPKSLTDRLNELSLPVKILLVLLPLLLLGLIVALIIGMSGGSNVAEGTGDSAPSISINSARLVSANAMVVTANTNLPNGTEVTAELLADNEPFPWFQSDNATATVQNGEVSMRLNKDPESGRASADASLQVVLSTEVNGQSVRSASELSLGPFEDDFVAQRPTATPRPSSTPTTVAATRESEPTPEPTPDTRGIVATVNNGGNVRAEPDADARIVGAIQLGDTVEVLEKNEASTWYRIETSSGVSGWTSVLALRPDAQVVAQTPIEGGIMPTPPVSTPTFALTTGVLVPVFHGGNVRSEPSLSSRLILDQVYTGETVELLARTSNGIWYQVKNPREQVGWVHTTLLRVPQDVAAQVPVQG
jgi:SH3-like domain-containing protein